MRARRITATAAGFLATVLAVGAFAATAGAGETAAGPAQAGVPAVAQAGVPAVAQAGVPASRTVTLITGDRVRLTSVDGARTVASLEPAAGIPAAGDRAAPRRARTMTVGERTYVVPDAALPYIGRQLDLALFDVANPPREVQISWSPGVAPRAVPGLTMRASGDGTTAEVSSPAALGAALAGDPAGGAMAGIEAIRPAAAPAVGGTAPAAAGAAVGAAPAAAAGAVPPTANPAYPQATLVVKGLNALGAPAVSGGVSVSNADDVLRFGSMRSFVEGEVAFSVPLGTYSLSIDITTFDSTNTYVSDALLVLPEIEVTGPRTEVTADARTARVPVPVPQTPQRADSRQVQMTYGRTAGSGTLSTTTYMLLGGAPKILVTPTAPVSLGEVHWYTYFHLSSPADSAAKYVYNLHLPSDGVVPARFPTRVSRSSLARIDASYHAETADHTINVHRASFAPWEFMPFRGTTTATAPMRRTEYVSALPDVGWVGVVNWRPAEGAGYVQGPLTVYRPGDRRPDTYLAAPLAPGAGAGSTEVQPCVACRQGDVLAVSIYPWKDPDGHTVDQLGSAGGAEARLYVNDTRYGLPGLPQGSITVPAADTAYRLEIDTSKSTPWSTTTTQSSTVWRWRSAARTETLPNHLRCADGTRDCAAEPLMLVDYQVPVGLDNAVPAGAAATIEIGVHRQDGGRAPIAEAVGFEISTDDGQTWQPATTRAAAAGRFTASVVPDAGAQFLSFRLRASDPQANSVEQTIIRAVRIASG